ncbi:hypothetical protein KAR91_09950 [Candidatus Pacearchaeota archaeon]|nr:hypothetical protein [Candidatus Pacearchaeota archaeon]
MPQVQLNIFGGFYENQSIPMSHQNLINWIPQIVEGEGLSQGALITPKSLVEFGTTGDNSNRGAIVMGGIPYVVNGNALYSFDSAGAFTNYGFISGAGRVSMASNGTKLAIVVPGGNAYQFDSGTSNITQVTDPDYITSDTVVFKDGFYVYTASDGSVFFNSALNDPLTFDALDFGTAEINPDRIITGHVNHNELFILGEETIEVFQNIGGSGFPFQRIPGANIQKGCYAKFSTVEFDNTFMFVGGGVNEKAAIWRVVSSQTAVKISTDAIDHAIQKFTEDEIALAFSYTFTVNGQFIVAFTFESDTIPDVTFCYNGTSKKWFQMQSGVDDNKWRVNAIVQAYGEILCADTEDGRLGKLDDVFTEYGETIYQERTSQPYMIDGSSQYWSENELFMETGTGLTSGQGSDPQIRMSYSDDGGRTFSADRARSFGQIGEYSKRVVWRRLGRVPFNRVVRFVNTDPVKANILKMEGTLEEGYN